MSFVSKARSWLLLVSEYAGVQIAVKALSAVGALLLINILPVEEYGVFTLLLATLTFLVSFSDFGATGSLLYFWRRAKKKVRIFSIYVHAVFRIRRSLFIGSAALSLIYLLGIYYFKQYDIVGIAVGSGLMILATWHLIQAGTWVYVFRVENHFKQSYVVEVAGELTKLIAVLLLWGTGFMYGWAAMACVLAGAYVSAKVASLFSGKGNTVKQVHGDRVMRIADGAVKGQVIPTIPWTIFFAVQGPLVAWLAATFGTVRSLAEVGALGRLGAIIGLISGFTISVFVPKLTHVHQEDLYLKYYLGWWLVLFGIGSILLGLIWIWPSVLLMLLGKQYKGLQIELFIAAATSVFMTFEYYAGAINRARGWIKGQALRIAVIVVGQVAMVPFLDFQLTADLLVFGLGTAILAMLVQLGFNVAGFWARHLPPNAGHAR